MSSDIVAILFGIGGSILFILGGVSILLCAISERKRIKLELKEKELELKAKYGVNNE